MATYCEGNKSDKKLRKMADETKKKHKLTKAEKREIKRQEAAARAASDTQLGMDLDDPKHKKTTAKEAHVNVSQTPVDETPAFSSTGPDTSTKAPKDTVEGKGSEGLLGHLKKDFELTKDFISDVGGTLSGDAMKAEMEAGGQVAMDVSTGKGKFDRLKQQGGDYLSKMGRDSKMLGGAKIAGYMVGTSMLLDMLNPFDDD